MKTTTLVATLVGGWVLFIQPVFAQQDGGSDAQIYRELGAATPPSFEEPWDAGGPVLAPAPGQPEYAQPGSMFVSPAPIGLIEPGNHPAISPTSPMLIPPDSMGRPAGEFDGRIR